MKAVAETAKWEGIAKLAGEQGNVADIKTALEKKANAERELALAQTDVTRVQKQEDALQAKIEEFDTLLDKAETDKGYLESSLKINRFNTAVNTVLKDNNGSAMSALERLREDVTISGFEAELSGEMAEETKGLEGKYALASGVSDDEVAKYLKK
jgi:phage shock protein A